MTKLVKCKACGTEVSSKASACPQCANPMKKSFKLGHTLVLLLFGLFMYSLLFPTQKPTPKAEPVPVTKEDIARKTDQLLAELKSIPVSEYSENLKRYETLVKMHPGNKTYSDKTQFYKTKLDRLDTIEKQFSAWNGEHKGFAKYIKTNLKNPDSYDHVKTVYVDKGDHILIETTYRASNSFGAIITEQAYAKSSINGQSLEIIGVK